MPHNFRLVADYLLAAGFTTQLLLIAMQARTWMQTRHSSLLLLLLSAAIGLVYLSIELVISVGAAAADRWTLYVVLAVLLTAQSIIGLCGAWSLFAAFEQKWRRSIRR